MVVKEIVAAPLFMIGKHDFDIDHEDEGCSDNNDSKETKVVPCPWQVNTQMMVIIMMMLATMSLRGTALDLLFMKGYDRNSATVNMKMGTVLYGNSDMRWFLQTMDKKGKEKSAKGDFLHRP